MELGQPAVNEDRWVSVGIREHLPGHTQHGNSEVLQAYRIANGRLDRMLVEVDGFRQQHNDHSARTEPFQ